MSNHWKTIPKERMLQTIWNQMNDGKALNGKMECWCSQNHVHTHTNTYRKYIFNLTCDNKHIHFTAILMFEGMWAHSTVHFECIGIQPWDGRRWVFDERTFLLVACCSTICCVCVGISILCLCNQWQHQSSWVELSWAEKKGNWCLRNHREMLSNICYRRSPRVKQLKWRLLIECSISWTRNWCTNTEQWARCWALSTRRKKLA